MFVEGGPEKGTLDLGFYFFHLPTSSPTVGLKSPSQCNEFGDVILTSVGSALSIICLTSVTSYPGIYLLDNFVFLKEICPKSGHIIIVC